ncbi:MAG: hypothetical protein ACOCW6_04300 [Spirochaetota bacterium]
MTKTNLSIIAALSLLFFGCGSTPDAASPDQTADGRPAVEPVIDLDQRPLVLSGEEELSYMVEEFSQVVDDAGDLLGDLRQGSVEEEAERIEGLRVRLNRWRSIAENVTIDPESSEISPEAYQRFTTELGSLRNRLWDVVLEINREIAEATGNQPEE